MPRICLELLEGALALARSTSYFLLTYLEGLNANLALRIQRPVQAFLAMAQPHPPRDEELSHNLGDFHEDYLEPKGSEFNQDLDSLKTHVTATQAGPNSDDLEYLATDAPQQHVAEGERRAIDKPSQPFVPAPKLFSKPNNDAASINDGFIWSVGPNKTSALGIKATPMCNERGAQPHVLSYNGTHSRHVTKQDEPLSSQHRKLALSNDIDRTASKDAEVFGCSEVLLPSSKLTNDKVPDLTPAFIQSEATQQTCLPSKENLTESRNDNTPPNLGLATQRNIAELKQASSNSTHSPTKIYEQNSNRHSSGTSPGLTPTKISDHNSKETPTEEIFPSKPKPKSSLAAHRQDSRSSSVDLPQLRKVNTAKVTKLKRSKIGASAVESTALGRANNPRQSNASSHKENSNEEGDGLTQEEVLNVLLYKMQKEKDVRDLEKAKYFTRTAELNQTRIAYEALKEKLEQLQARDQEQQQELLQFKEAVPKMKQKLGDLQENLQTLVNDNHEMKERTQGYKALYEKWKDERELAAEEYERTIQSVSRFQAKSRQILEELHPEIQRLRQVVQNQQIFMDDNTELLDEQRLRNDQLENDISNLIDMQRQADNNITKHMSSISEKLEEVMGLPKAIEQDHLNRQFQLVMDALSQSASILEEIRTKPAIHQDDLQSINATIQHHTKSVFDALTKGLEKGELLDQQTKDTHETLVSHFEKLATMISIEQQLSEKITEYQTMQAKTEETLRITTVQLQNTDVKVLNLENDKKQLEKEKSVLTVQLDDLRARPVQDSTLTSRVAQLEDVRSGQQAEIARLNIVINQQREDIDTQKGLKEKLEMGCNSLQNQLNESEANYRRLEHEQKEYDKKLATEINEVRVQLVKAADDEKAGFQTRYRTAMHDAQIQQLRLKHRIAHLEVEVQTAKEEDAKHKSENERLTKSLDSSSSDFTKQKDVNHQQAITISKLQNEKSEVEERHKREVEKLEEGLETRVEHITKIEQQHEQYRSDMEARESECLETIKSRLQFHQCEISHTNLLDALQLLIKKEEEAWTERIAQNKEKASVRELDDLEAGTSLTLNSDIPDSENATCLEESQELPYRALGPFTNVDEFRDPQHARTPKSGKDDPQYYPMVSLMKRCEAPRFGINGVRLETSNALGSIQDGDTQEIRYVVEESQLVHQRIASSPHGSTPKIPARAPNSSARMSHGTGLAKHLEGLEMIEEATSPVGNTRGLFPPTPMPDSRQGSGQTNLVNEGRDRRPTEQMTSVSGENNTVKGTFRTPNKPLQPRDANTARMGPFTKASLGETPFQSQPTKETRQQDTSPNTSTGGQHSKGSKLNKFKPDNSYIENNQHTETTGPPQTEPRIRPKRPIETPLKRKSTGAESNNYPRSRRRKVEAEELGPTIGSSKSPGMGYSKGKLTGQARKSTRRKSQGK